MKRLAFLFLALASAGAAAGQGAADRARGRCVAGTPSDPNLPGVRPMPVAICSYGPAEFHARIERLLAVRQGRLDIELVERIFSLPRVTTPYDKPRSTYYAVSLRSAPGIEPWNAGIQLSEDFGPELESRPVRFRGSGRPVRINRRERGDVRAFVNMIGVPDVELAPGQPICLTATELRDREARRGWAVMSTNDRVSHNAPPGTRNMALSRGGLRFSTSTWDGHPCVENFMLFQPADPPIQPITPEEREAIRRSRAE